MNPLTETQARTKLTDNNHNPNDYTAHRLPNGWRFTPKPKPEHQNIIGGTDLLISDNSTILTIPIGMTDQLATEHLTKTQQQHTE